MLTMKKALRNPRLRGCDVTSQSPSPVRGVVSCSDSSCVGTAKTQEIPETMHRRDGPDRAADDRGSGQDLPPQMGSVVALDGVDMVVEPGEFVTLIGPSGCGKSTLFNIVAGLVASDWAISG